MLQCCRTFLPVLPPLSQRANQYLSELQLQNRREAGERYHRRWHRYFAGNPPALKTHSIFRDQLMLMVSPQNALAKLEVVPISEIVKQPLLLPKTGYSRRLMDKLFRPYASHVQIRMELPSVGMIKSFVAAGLGVSLTEFQLRSRPGAGWQGQAHSYQGRRTLAGIRYRLPARSYPYSRTS